MTALVHQFIKANPQMGGATEHPVLLGENLPKDGEHLARMYGATAFMRFDDASITYEGGHSVYDSIVSDTYYWGEADSSYSSQPALKYGRDSSLKGVIGGGWYPYFSMGNTDEHVAHDQKMSIEFTYQNSDIADWANFSIEKPNHYKLWRQAGAKGGGSSVRLEVYGPDPYASAGLLVVATGTFPADGNPHHVVYTWDGNAGTIDLYIDGVWESSTALGAVNTVPSDFLTFYHGAQTLQDVALYGGTCLTQSQITNLYRVVSAASYEEKDTIANLRLTSDIAGGPIAASAAVSSTLLEAYSDFFKMGTKWNIYYEDEYPNNPIWGGHLRDSVQSGGLGALVAEGYGKRADQEADRFMLQTQNLDNWTSGQSEPIDYEDEPLIGVEVHGSNMVFEVQKNAQFQTNKAGNPPPGNDRWTSGMYMWVPTKDLRRVAGTIHKARRDRNYEFQIVATPTGPSGALQILHTEQMSQAGNIDFDVAIDPGYDLIGIRLRRKTKTKRAKRRVFQIKNLRVSMFPEADVPDDLQLDGAMQLLFDQMTGIDYTTIGASTKEILPYDAARATWGQIADELCIFDRWYWGIYPENSAGERRGIAQTFGTKVFHVEDPKLPVELLPETRYNAVFFEYQYAENIYVTDLVIAEPTDAFPTEYNATYNLSWEDPPPSPVAQLFAQSVANFLVTERTTGRMTLTSALREANDNLLTSVEADCGPSAVSGNVWKKNWQGTLSDETSQYRTGGSAVKLVSVTDEYGAAYIDRLIPLDGADSVAVSAWIKADAGTPAFYLTMYCYDEDDVLLTTVANGTQNLTTSYAQYSDVLIPEPGTASIKFAVQNTGSGAPTFYIDDVDVHMLYTTPTRVGHIRPGDKLILDNHGDLEVIISNVDMAQDGSYANIQFTTGNPLLERWLAHRNRYLNSGRDAAWATLKALDVEQPIAPENVVIGFHRTESHRGRPKYNLIVDWDDVVEDIDGNGTAIHHYDVRVRPLFNTLYNKNLVSITSTLVEPTEGDAPDYYECDIVLNNTTSIDAGDLIMLNSASGYGDGPWWSVQEVVDGTTLKIRTPTDLGDYTGSPDVNGLSYYKQVPENQGGGWLKKTVQDHKEDDLSEISVASKAVFKDISSPNTWIWDVRVRAEDLIGQQSDWSVAIEPDKAAAFRPDPPTAAVLKVGQHEMEVTWSPPSGINDGDGDAHPSEDIAHYKVRLLKNGSTHKTDTAFTTRHIFKIEKPGTHTWRARVWSVDSFGNLSSSYADSGNETRETVPTPTQKPTIAFSEDPETRDNLKATVTIYYDAASYTDDDINYYALQWQHSPDANFNSGFSTTKHQIEAGDTTIDIKRITARHYYRVRFRAVDMEGKKSEWGSWTRATRARIA